MTGAAHRDSARPCASTGGDCGSAGGRWLETEPSPALPHCDPQSSIPVAHDMRHVTCYMIDVLMRVHPSSRHAPVRPRGGAAPYPKPGRTSQCVALAGRQATGRPTTRRSGGRPLRGHPDPHRVDRRGYSSRRRKPQQVTHYRSPIYNPVRTLTAPAHARTHLADRRRWEACSGHSDRPGARCGRRAATRSTCGG